MGALDEKGAFAGNAWVIFLIRVGCDVIMGV